MSTTTDRGNAPRQAPESGPDDGKLEKGVLGTGHLIVFVVAAAAPLTVMAGVAPLAIARGGIGAPAAYALTGAILALFAVGYTAMSRHITNAGAFYVYISRGLNRTLGLGSAYLATFAYAVIGIGLYGFFGLIAEGTFQDLIGFHLPWQAWTAIALVVVWYLAHRSIALSATVLGVALSLEALILLIVAVAVVVQGGADGLSLEPFKPSNAFTGSSGALFALSSAAFLGFEATAIFSEESKNPRRTIPRATYGAIAFLAIFYAFITWSTVMAFGPDKAQAAAASDITGMFYAMADQYVGAWAVDVMRILLVTSAIAAILAFHNAASRYLFALGREGAMPRALARTHERHRSPWIAGVVMAVVSAIVCAAFAIAGLDPYNDLFILVNSPGLIGIIALQILAGIAVIGFFRRNARGESRWSTVIAPVLAIIGLVTMLVFVTKNMSLLTARDSTVNTAIIGSAVVVFAIGVGVAVWLRRNRPEVYGGLATTRLEDDDAPAPVAVPSAGG